MELSERQRRFLEALSRTQFLPPDQLRAYQHSLLDPLIRHAIRNVPFYHDRLRAALASDGAPDLSRWAEVPILDRAAAQAAGSALFADSLPFGNDLWVEDRTPGITAPPMCHRRSNLTDLATRCQGQRDYDWYGMDCSQTLASIRESRDGSAPYPYGSKSAPWNMRGAGETVVLDSGAGAERQVDWLLRMKPRYLSTHPSLLDALADHVLASGRIGIWIDVVLTVGEPLAADVRNKAQRAFGARVFDRYGVQELGHIAAECPDCGQYHVSAESILVEVLRDDGTPASPGETGQLVVTSLYNFAMPLIRYQPGDCAEVGIAGACQRTLPSLRRIFGHARRMSASPGASMASA
jgi:phenylacetate-CoA ligase